jgi:hypothetical protein
MTEPFKPALAADHAAHDATLLAALAARDPDLTPPERARAEAAIEGCGPCADLFADLVAVSAAIPSMATPARPRDFKLTDGDAARLRPRGLRRWLAAIGTARDGISFPLALGLTTMGIAGLLVATVPAILPMGASTTVLSTVGAPVGPVEVSGGAAPAASAAPAAAAASPAPAQATDLYAATGAPDPEPETAGEGAFTGDDGDGIAQRQDATEMAQESSKRDDRTGLSALVVLATALLVMGLGLFMLRWNARRL